MRTDVTMHGVGKRKSATAIQLDEYQLRAKGVGSMQLTLHADTWTEIAEAYDGMGRPALNTAGPASERWAFASMTLGGVEVVLFPPPNPSPWNLVDSDSKAIGLWDLAMNAYDRGLDAHEIVTSPPMHGAEAVAHGD